MTFSGHQPLSSLFSGGAPSPGRILPEMLLPALTGIIKSNGFEINAEKLHYADRYSRRMVTGLKVDELLNVDRRYVRNIRAALYCLATTGKEAAQTKFEKASGKKSDIAAHLRGKINWLRFIRGQSDPVFRALALKYNTVFPSNPLEIKATVDEIKDRSIWVVEHFEGEMSQGSAFFLDKVGLVAAAHCVHGTMAVEVYHPSKPANRFAAQVLKRDDDRDLALLSHSIPNTEYFALKVTNKNISVGDNLTAYGYPGFGPGDSLNVRAGHVSSLPTKHGVHLIEVTQKLSQGMSGGPLLDSDDAVVGVIHRGGPSEGRDFAVHINVLKSWLS